MDLHAEGYTERDIDAVTVSQDSRKQRHRIICDNKKSGHQREAISGMITQ